MLAQLIHSGILIEASDDVTVQVGAINDFSSDAFLAFPADAMALDYYVTTYLYSKEPQLGTKQVGTCILPDVYVQLDSSTGVIARCKLLNFTFIMSSWPLAKKVFS